MTTTPTTPTLRYFTLPGPERRRICRWVRVDGVAFGPFFHSTDEKRAKAWLAQYLSTRP